MRLDIVIPVHNEQQRIDTTLHAFRDRMVDSDIRFVVAMEGCTDATADVVARHAAADARVIGVEYPGLGKGRAVLETLRRSDAEVMGFVDGDCATSPAGVARLTDAVQDADLVVAARRHSTAVLPPRRPSSRRLEGGLLAGAVRALFGRPHREARSGAKVFRREVADAVLPELSSRGFLFDVELLMSARAMGFRVAEVPTVWVDRPASAGRPGHHRRHTALSALRVWLHLRAIPPPAPAPRAAEPAAPEAAGDRPGAGVQGGDASDEPERVGETALDDSPDPVGP